MPIFEYECAKCGSRFELLVMPGEQPACRKCGSKRVNKLISACVTRTVGGGSTGSACTSCTASTCATCGSAGGRG